ncbi:MAG TPA: signal peptidase II [Candidatus Andersenbacteria bacterium]|nr:signal peptidase II [Candidatus Andersenbacteria bacterium]
MGYILPVIAVLVLIAVIIKKNYTFALPLTLVLAGGVSNYIDVLRFGYVRDPLSIGSFVFNVADICILAGTLWAIWVYTRR